MDPKLGKRVNIYIAQRNVDFYEKLKNKSTVINRLLDKMRVGDE